MARSFDSRAVVAVIVLTLIALIGCGPGRSALEGTQWRLAASLIPGARRVVMPAGHAPFAEVPDTFRAEVLPFLGRCAGNGETDEG